MAHKRNRKDVDLEVDLHGLTAEQLRTMLQQQWPRWRGLNRVRIVHGQGAVLKPEIARWCHESGVPYLPDTHNSGALVIFPRQRTLPDTTLANTLAEKGLQLSPEEEAYLRDPARIERERHEARRRQLLEEQRRRAQEAARTTQQRRDEILWQAEMARLGVLEKKGGKSREDTKLRPPVILPPVQIKVEEGYWRAELSRVAETDTDTLQVQKRTGLDKLAPPMKDERQEARDPKSAEAQTARRDPQRDTEAEKALFEAEMERLSDFDGFEVRRAKRD